MCGIAGFESRGDDFGRLAGSLLDSLSSRGPDGPFQRETSGYGLVQTRLAVIDLSDRVIYPMPNENEDLWLIFNGEIYDHATLQLELESLGHRFRTDCDAEVIIHGFEQWGLDIFRKLNGMFALALVDDRNGEITLARDATGIKPLVKTIGDRFGFASDAMALVSAGLSRGEVDERAIAEYAAFQYVPPPLTGIADVVQVEPGTAITRSRDGSERTVRWSPVYFDAPSPDRPVSMEELNQTLLDSMSRQLVADVEVGVFLSGGVDSSLIAALAVELGAKPQAFTVSFEGHGDYDEATRASLLAKSLGIPHHVEKMSVGFTDAVEGVANAYDQPFADSSAIPMLALSRFARSRVTVALSGTGGDDLFAGYYRHRAHRLLRALHLIPDRLTAKLAEAPIQRGAERGSAFTLARSYGARIAKAGTGDAYSQYLALVGGMTPEDGMNIPSGGKRPVEIREGVASRLKLRHPGSGSTLRQLQRFELQSYLPGDLLTKEDRASMAFGLEARVPLLDAEVVALAQRVPDRQKVSLLGGKLLLRKLAREKLPANKRSGRKRGFAVPLRDFFDGPWQVEAKDWLNDSGSALIDGPAAARMLDAEHSKASDVWTLAALAAWEQRLDRCRRAASAA